ncbi:uncharacterized protein LOC117647814 isoform X2 [Thrips palmi]|nr:uncharacterized protein LOC117647814 isoform X2 [Thrips palmi]
MTEHFTQKCSKGSFGSFKFGSVMMRTCHYLNSPDDALKIAESEILRRWLNDPISNIVLMDLLIESGRSKEAAEVYEKLFKSEWFFALRNPLIPILYAISLYKQGTADSFDRANKLCSNLVTKLIYKQKIEDIIAAFALKVKQANIARHLVQKREANSELSWNIMVQANVMQSHEGSSVLQRRILQRNQHHVYKDTFAAIQATYPDLVKSLKIKPINLTVEEQVLGTIHIEDKDHVEAKRKRYY